MLAANRIAFPADSIGWAIRNDTIWNKIDPAPESPRNRWRSGQEHILFLTKRPSGYRFNADNIRVPYAAATLRRWGAGQSYGGPKSRERKDAKDSRMRDGQTFKLNPRGCLPTDVWSLPVSNTSERHYAAFPEQIVRPIIEACSEPADLVIDPFAGSGTTCRVAAALSRCYLGIDLNPQYVALASATIRSSSTQAA